MPLDIACRPILPLSNSRARERLELFVTVCQAVHQLAGGGENRRWRQHCFRYGRAAADDEFAGGNRELPGQQTVHRHLDEPSRDFGFALGTGLMGRRRLITEGAALFYIAARLAGKKSCEPNETCGVYPGITYRGRPITRSGRADSNAGLPGH